MCSVGLTVENKGNKDFTSGYIDIMLIYDQDETHNKVLWMRDTPLMSGSKPRGFEIWTFNNRCPNFKKAMIRRIL